MRAVCHMLAAAMAALVAALAASPAAAAKCGVDVKLSAPKTVVAGRKFTTALSVKNTGTASLTDVYVQLQLPDFLQPQAASAPLANKRNAPPEPVRQGRFVTFRGLRLPVHKKLRLKATVGVPACQAAGPVTLQGMAYQLDLVGNVTCTSVAAPITTTVRVSPAAARSKHAVQGNCTRPTPGTSGIALLGTNERCLQSVPLPDDAVRRFRELLAGAVPAEEDLVDRADDRKLSVSQSAAQACFACCGEYLDATPPYYFNLDADGRCYCCETCSPIYVPDWTIYVGLQEPVWAAINGTVNPFNNNWFLSVTSSPDGAQLLACTKTDLYRSQDYGLTWTIITGLNPGGEWSSVKCSSGFEVCLALARKSAGNQNGEIFRSTNGGTDWAVVPGTKLGKWAKATCDATGQKWIALAEYLFDFAVRVPGAIFVSTNAGANFSMVTGSNDTYWSAAACDATFTKCVVGPKYYSEQGWKKSYSLTNLATLTELTGAPVGDYSAFAMTADGQRILAAIESNNTNDGAGNIWYSPSGGQSWTKMSVPDVAYSGLACDDTLTHCAASAYYDKDYSDTQMVTTCSGFRAWTANSDLGFWTAVAVDADGGRMVAAGVTLGAQSQVQYALHSYPLAIPSPAP